MQRHLEISDQQYVRAPSFNEEAYRNFIRKIELQLGKPIHRNAYKFIEVQCIPYNLRFQTFITPTMTWKMLKKRIYILMTHEMAKYALDMPIDIQDIAIGSHHITIRGKRGSQDIHSKRTPFESLPAGGIIYVNQVFRYNTWILLNQGWP